MAGFFQVTYYPCLLGSGLSSGNPVRQIAGLEGSSNTYLYPRGRMMLNFAKSADGLLPAIVQDYKTGDVLMLAYINELSWQKTVETGKAHYWSRSRQSLWLKGESSGHVQMIHDILVDCDADTVVFKVEQIGDAACHTGHRTCFYRRLVEGELVTEGKKVFDPEKVYGKK